MRIDVIFDYLVPEKSVIINVDDSGRQTDLSSLYKTASTHITLRLTFRAVRRKSECCCVNSIRQTLETDICRVSAFKLLVNELSRIRRTFLMIILAGMNKYQIGIDDSPQSGFNFANS